MAHCIAIDWARFHMAERALGLRFDAAIEWFRADGASALAAIERAVVARDAMTVIRTAGLLKTDAMQIGALCVSEHAEACENAARDCFEGSAPWAPVVRQMRLLRQSHTATIDQFGAELLDMRRRVA
jgi:histidine phosphotransfer protein HptB